MGRVESGHAGTLGPHCRRVDEQRASSGPPRGRDPKGRFQSGNPDRWKPGESGNPKGQKPSIVRALNKLLSDNPKLQEELAAACVTHALAGNQAYFKLAIEYLDGKVPDVVRIDRPIIRLLPPGVARGKYEIDDDGSAGNPDPTAPTDEGATPRPE